MIYSSSQLAVYQLLFALSSINLVFAAPNVWSVSIDNFPAPPPESGPPLSAGALRDTAYLPFELVGLFGAYLIVTITIAISILTIGRRRRAIQSSPKSLGMDMLKPETGLTGEGRPSRKPAAIRAPGSQTLFGPSPTSPSKFWSSPNLSLKHGWENITGKSFKKSSIADVSIMAADDGTPHDRTRDEIEMDRLYAAVAEHEAAKAQAASVDGSPQAQYPPELQHLRHGGRSSMAHGPVEMLDPYASRTPSDPSPASSTSPHERTASAASSKRLAKKTPPPALSLRTTDNLSRATDNSSRSSIVSAASRSSRRWPISPPMASPGMSPDYGDSYGEAEPLTPRVYAPGPPPLPPIANALSNRQQHDTQRETRQHREVLSPTKDSFTPTARTHFTPSIRSSRTSVSTTRSSGFPKSPRTPRDPTSARTANFPRTITEQPSAEVVSHLPQSPRSTRHTRGQSYASCESDIKPGFEFALSPAPSGHTIRFENSAASPTESTHTTNSSSKKEKKRFVPPQLTINPVGSQGSTSTLPTNPSSHNLPLRTAPLPLRDLRSPTTQSMGIKATVLDRPTKRGPAGGLLRAPGTAGLAGPATPYSPYMPQTPMTPMTPSRLVGREERKRREKEERRRVLTEDDVVKEEDEMWE